MKIWTRNDCVLPGNLYRSGDLLDCVLRPILLQRLNPAWVLPPPSVVVLQPAEPPSLGIRCGGMSPLSLSADGQWITESAMSWRHIKDMWKTCKRCVINIMHKKRFTIYKGVFEPLVLLPKFISGLDTSANSNKTPEISRVLQSFKVLKVRSPSLNISRVKLFLQS